MTTDQDTISALTQAVGASEAGRRVGWARAYSAEASKDELSREINVLRSERDIMRKAASFMLGFMRVYVQRRGDTGAAQQALANWSHNIDRVLDDEVIRAGRNTADRVIKEDESLAERRSAGQAEKKAKQRDERKAERHYRSYERHYLAKKFGFANEAALLNYLEQNL